MTLGFLKLSAVTKKCSEAFQFHKKNVTDQLFRSQVLGKGPLSTQAQKKVELNHLVVFA